MTIRKILTLKKDIRNLIIEQEKQVHSIRKRMRRISKSKYQVANIEKEIQEKIIELKGLENGKTNKKTKRK